MPTAAQVIELAKKIQGYTTSPNVNEASVAAEKLQQLLMAHNIEEWELDTEERPAYGHMAFDVASGGIGDDKTWKRSLLDAVAEASSCRSIAFRGTTKCRVYGTRLNIQTARYMYKYLAEAVVRLEAEYWDDLPVGFTLPRKEHARAFYYGAVTTLTERLAKQTADITAQSNSALVYVNETAQALTDLLERDFPAAKALMQKATLNTHSYHAGQKAAAGINLDQQVTAGNVAIGAGV